MPQWRAAKFALHTPGMPGIDELQAQDLSGLDLAVLAEMATQMRNRPTDTILARE